jgi:hypothetical protein
MSRKDYIIIAHHLSRIKHFIKPECGEEFVDVIKDYMYDLKQDNPAFNPSFFLEKILEN